MEKFLVRVYLRSSIGSHEDPVLVRRFIEYYKFLGIEDFFICLNEKGDSDKVRQVLSSMGISPATTWRGDYSEYIRLEKLNKMISGLSSRDWVISADVDEFQHYPDSLADIIEESESGGYEWIQGGIVDRFALGGALPSALCPSTPLEQQFPIEGSVHKIKKGIKLKTAIDGYEGREFQPKITLHKKRHSLSRGFHRLGNFDKSSSSKLRAHPMRIKVNHFKWFGSVLQKLINIQQEDLNAKKPSNAKKDHIINHIKEEGKINLKHFSIKKNNSGL